MRELILAPIAGVALLAGCAAPTTGEQTQQPSKMNSSGTVSLPHSGAPKVLHPLDQAKLQTAQGNPCDTLTNAQTSTLRLITHGTYRDAEAGPFCGWSNTAAGSTASVYFPTKIIFEGLSQIYEKSKNEGRAKYFYPMSLIQGFPVVASSAADLRDLGGCTVQVGLTDRQVMYVGITVSRAKRGQLEPCAAARDVAGMALSTMKSGV
jgi:hypothetical protein